MCASVHVMCWYFLLFGPVLYLSWSLLTPPPCHPAVQLLGLGHQGSQLWNVEKIHSKNVIAIVHLLVALVRHYRAPIRLPENVFAKVVIVKVRGHAVEERGPS